MAATLAGGALFPAVALAEAPPQQTQDHPLVRTIPPEPMLSYPLLPLTRQKLVEEKADLRRLRGQATTQDHNTCTVANIRHNTTIVQTFP